MAVTLKHILGALWCWRQLDV